MAELKPCPFCGGSVTLERATDTYEYHHGRRQWWGVVCRNTENRGGTCAIHQRPSASPEAAIVRWNTRASPASPSQPMTPEHAQQAFGHVGSAAGVPSMHQRHTPCKHCDAKLGEEHSVTCPYGVGIPAADYLAKVEADPKRAAALQRARDRAAAAGVPGTRTTLTEARGAFPELQTLPRDDDGVSGTGDQTFSAHTPMSFSNSQG
jgi:hypothetical protein